MGEAQSSAEWVISMTGKLKEAQEYVEDKPWDSWCIYQVPRRFRDAHDNNVYAPQTISIGPYHHADEQLRPNDRLKWIALHRILQRTGQDITLYINAIKKVEKNARRFYQQDFSHLSSYQFVEIMLLDACFILEIFRRSPKAAQRSHYEDVLGGFSQLTIDDILLDMIFLENQIPLFILDMLLELIYKDQEKEQATTLALNLFNPEWLTGAPVELVPLEELKSTLKRKECLHVLDVFRQGLLHQGTKQEPLYKHQFWLKISDKLFPKRLNKWFHIDRVSNRARRGTQVIHKVTELRKAGVKIRKGSSNAFWDIKFKNNGTLEIPPISIQDSTKSILLNLATFEQCHVNIKDNVIASYAVFMECLIKSPEDVTYLHRHGIIQHFLGNDDEVVDMFKSVSKEMVVDGYGGHYSQLTNEVNEYYNKRRNRWRASLVNQYLNNPWHVISLVAAVILLLLTAAQTFYTVYPYYNKPSSS